MKIITPQMKKSNTIKQLKFKNMKLALITTLTNFILLTSCSKDWSCPAEKGFSCMSISQVDGGDQTSNNVGSKTQGNKEVKVNKNLLTSTIKNIKTDELAPIRTQEVIGKILLTPYIDKEGNLHSGKYIHTVDEKPEWRIMNNGN